MEFVTRFAVPIRLEKISGTQKNGTFGLKLGHLVIAIKSNTLTLYFRKITKNHCKCVQTTEQIIMS